MTAKSITKEYFLSQWTIEKLGSIKDALKENIFDVDETWRIVSGKIKEDVDEIDEETTYEELDENALETIDHSQFPSTQFYFTQVQENFNDESVQTSIQKFDLMDGLYESLERSNGKIDLGQLKNLSDEEVLEVVENLEKRLSTTGTYNLCRSMNGTSIEHRARCVPVLCTHLLLPKIISLQEPSRLLSSAMVDSVRQFPDEIQKLIFIPLLNVNLKDTTIVNAIAEALGVRRKDALIADFVASVKDLKIWHVSLLQNFLSYQMEYSTNEKLLRLFAAKALDFSRNRNFGKLLLSFVKANTSFSTEEKKLLREITDVNETVFRKPIESILKNA